MGTTAALFSCFYPDAHSLEPSAGDADDRQMIELANSKSALEQPLNLHLQYNFMLVTLIHRRCHTNRLMTFVGMVLFHLSYLPMKASDIGSDYYKDIGVLLVWRLVIQSIHMYSLY